MKVADELPAIPGGWTDEDIVIGGRPLRVTRPARPDAFLDDPNVSSRMRGTTYAVLGVTCAGGPGNGGGGGNRCVAAGAAGTGDRGI